MGDADATDALNFQPRKLPLHGLQVPAAGHVDLWFLDLVALGNPLSPLEPISRDALTPRQQRGLRRFYLRLLLGAYLGIAGKDVQVSRAVRGKPRLDQQAHAGSDLQFSSANSDACCLVGVTSATPIGVDLELTGRLAKQPLALARRYFSDDEYLALLKLEGERLDEAFLHTWACKEAVVKAAGHGIANQLCRFTVNVHPGQAPAVLAIDEDDPAAWRMAVFRPGRHHLGAVTVRHPGLEVQGFALLPPG
jgi:4'-phosphopantetheinyl transferase